MKWNLICAAGLLVVAGATGLIAAGVVDVMPQESYGTTLQPAGWDPPQKTYSLANTSFDWVYFEGYDSSGKVICAPGKGWIAPGMSVNVAICPDESMATAEPGTYSQQITLDFDPRLVGDIDGDATVDVVDLLSFSAAWGTRPGDAVYDAACDFNGDNVIDSVDLIELAGSWTKVFGSTEV